MANNGITAEEKEKCNYIIHGAATAAGAIGVIPIPGSDILPLIGVQVSMIIALARVFNYPITENIAKEMVKTYLMGQAAKILAAQLAKLIPFGSAANATVAVGLTEVLGWETAEKFKKEISKS